MCVVAIRPITARPLILAAGLVNVARLGPVLREVQSYPVGPDVGSVVGAVVPSRDPADGWVVASRHGFADLDRSGRVAPIPNPSGAPSRA